MADHMYLLCAHQHEKADVSFFMKTCCTCATWEPRLKTTQHEKKHNGNKLKKKECNVACGQATGLTGSSQLLLEGECKGITRGLQPGVLADRALVKHTHTASKVVIESVQKHLHI
eukprot:1153635-Pelagomonas_calceolata.AAC.3